jgi:hypothetical protein
MGLLGSKLRNNVVLATDAGFSFTRPETDDSSALTCHGVIGLNSTHRGSNPLCPASHTGLSLGISGAHGSADISEG